MMRLGENNHHVHDGYGKEMALSLDVKDTDEDKDEDKRKKISLHDLLTKLQWRI